MLVYIGAPIDRSSDFRKHFDELRALVIEARPNAAIFDPSSAFVNALPGKNSYSVAPLIALINNAALDAADVAVFMLNSQPTYGTILEIERALHRDRPCAIWAPNSPSPSFYLAKAMLSRTGYHGSGKVLYSTDRSKVLEFIRQVNLDDGGTRASVVADFDKLFVQSPPSVVSTQARVDG